MLFDNNKIQHLHTDRFIVPERNSSSVEIFKQMLATFFLFENYHIFDIFILDFLS